MAPTLYMTEISPSSRAVLMVASALGIEVTRHYIDLSSGEQFTPEFLKLNPQHTVPVWVEEDGKVLWDGHAIIFYLVNKYGKDDSFYPSDPYTRAVIHQMLHFDAEYIFPPISTIARDIFHGEKKVNPSLINKIKESYEILEKLLEGHLFAVGNQITLADFSLIATTSATNILIPINSKSLPNIAAWMKRVESSPYYKANLPGLKICKKILERFI